MPPHLANAARTLERLLHARHPEHHWIVSLREDHPLNRLPNTPTAPDRQQPRAVTHHPHTIPNRDTMAPAGLPDDHNLDQAA
jgi:hypothetical protein